MTSLLPRMLVIIFLTNTSHFLSFNYIVSLIGVPRATGSHSHCPSKTTTGPTHIVLARNLFQTTWLHQRSVSDGKMTILILFWATSFILKNNYLWTDSNEESNNRRVIYSLLPIMLTSAESSYTTEPLLLSNTRQVYCPSSSVPNSSIVRTYSR